MPVLPRGVRLHRDRVRDQWVLLAPERALALDVAGHAVLSEVDGARDFDAIVAILAERYRAPPERIAADAAGFLDALAARRIVDVAAAGPA